MDPSDKYVPISTTILESYGPSSLLELQAHGIDINPNYNPITI